jgi:hypothetical protein
VETAFELVEPNAPAMIESLRAVGYTVQAAVADLIDNSISAHSRNVWVSFHWDGSRSFVSITDDGDGMDGESLTEAMRLGSRGPLEDRDPSDLGRFGLGLKTASFSQCRRLTVWSRTDAPDFAVRCWDLDYVCETGEWRLLKEAAPGPSARSALLKEPRPKTIVVWENLDRLTDNRPVDDERAHDRFLETIEAVEKHLAMVFHRFLEPPTELAIWINGQPIAPWDPFLRAESATQQLAEETFATDNGRVVVRPFVLPHHTRLSLDVHQRAAGPGGWNARQGFYVYRNRRLLVPGDWLHLGFQKEEHAKLARIQVDIPNTLDSTWQIDVKKSTARPPGALREELRRIAKVTRKRATEIYRHRGKVIARSATRSDSFVWKQIVRHGKVSYRVNREHPFVQDALELAGENRKQVESLIRVIEETVPAPLISLQSSQAPDEQALPFDGATSEVAGLLQRLFDSLRASGLTREEARVRLAAIEPFNHFAELIAILEDVPA